MKQSNFPTFEQIRAFLMVVEHGSFSSAAATLKTTQATVSRNVAALEEIIGEPLLHRTSRALKMTEAGQVFKGYAHQLLQCWQSAKLRIENETQALKGDVKFAAPQLFSQMYIVKCLPRFLNSHPELNVHLHITEERESLLEKGYDLVVRSGNLGDSNLYYQPACQSRLVLIASPRFLENLPAIESPSDLPLESCLTFRKDSQWIFEKNNEKETIKPNSRFSTTSPSMLLELIKNGYGITVSPVWIAASSINSHELVTILDEYKIESEIEAYCHVNFLYPTRKPPQKVQILMELIRLQVEKEKMQHPNLWQNKI